MNCMLAKYMGKEKTEECCGGVYCFPYRKLYGESGEGGLIGLANIPKKYKDVMLEDLPIKEQNPSTYETIETYIENVT